MESLAVFWNSYVPSFFQHACPGKPASRAVMSADIVQKAHPAAKGPMSTRVVENIFREVGMVELIYPTKEGLKQCLA